MRPRVAHLLRRCARAGLGLSALLAAGCADSVPVDAAKVAACTCPAEGCPKDRCDLQIEVSAASCSKQGVTKVEILVGAELDPGVFVPGTPRRTCATIPRGTVAHLHARADAAWQWDEDVACPPATAQETRGPTLARLLNCGE